MCGSSYRIYFAVAVGMYRFYPVVLKETFFKKVIKVT